MAELDLTADVVDLTRVLVDTPSVSGDEGPLADAVESALRAVGHLQVERDGDAVVARTDLGRSERVVVAGHLDTVPIADNVPSRLDGDRLWGCGSSDMKSGDAVMLKLAAEVAAPVRDVTWVFYDCEEVEAARNGLGRLARDHTDWLRGDLAVVMEGTNALVEAGCQGSLRADITVRGTRAHSARSWLGDNAIHGAGAVLDRLRAYEAATIEVDGLEYREGLNAVGISGGVAGNIIPDLATVTVNYRFAPSRDVEAAERVVRDLFDGYEVEIVDAAPSAAPGLSAPIAQSFAAAVGGEPLPKLGWTDVARFAALGIPALNYGPGNPDVAHRRDEHVLVPLIRRCEDVLRRWLTG